ncbi:hypothetical protein GGX14DRAFT_404013 [Mycena pura]|uniref:Uncharacterized protein n=1 Tax=Mycena pura TaxID=153505 RepID=A0AAD6UVA2_9AGAR|nr:hypothetical protein GGX14DRAFT_404013 [Mycena pura]
MRQGQSFINEMIIPLGFCAAGGVCLPRCEHQAEKLAAVPSQICLRETKYDCDASSLASDHATRHGTGCGNGKTWNDTPTKMREAIDGQSGAEHSCFAHHGQRGNLLNLKHRRAGRYWQHWPCHASTSEPTAPEEYCNSYTDDKDRADDPFCYITPLLTLCDGVSKSAPDSVKVHAIHPQQAHVIRCDTCLIWNAELNRYVEYFAGNLCADHETSSSAHRETLQPEKNNLKLQQELSQEFNVRV